MSTVAEIIDNIQDFIPDDKVPKIFPAINRVLRLLAKELYIQDSDLIIGELNLPIYASIDYTASTIAFVDGQSDEDDQITDSDSGFVTEGFKADMAITTDCPGNLGPFRISSVAAGSLALHRSSQVSDQVAGSSYTLISDAGYAFLPDDFWGLIERPYISGLQWELKPLPSQNEGLYYASAGQSTYYKLKGEKMLRVYPPTATDIVLCGDYFKKPPTMTTMEDIIPYDELLDDAIEEYLIRVLGEGSAQSAADLASFIEYAVARIVSKRPKAAPKKMPEGINWEEM